MSILHDYFHIRNRCARWIFISLTDEQWWGQAEWCKFMSPKFHEGCSNLTRQILTGDKTWYDLETKMQPAVWLFPDESQPLKLKRSCVHCRKSLPVSWENQAMSTPFLLWSDRKSQQTVTCTTVSQKSSKFGDSTAKRWDSVAFFFSMKMPLHTAAMMVDLFNEREVPLLLHPWYSPRLGGRVRRHTYGWRWPLINAVDCI